MISFIIVEYHCLEEILACIKNFSKFMAVPYEICVSSNSGYTPEEQEEILQTTDDSITWLFNERNGGFAYAMNRGLEVAKGDYMVIMNSDCKLKGNIQDMVDFLEANPEVGAIAPQIRDEEDNIQDSARHYVSLPSYLWRQFKRVVGRNPIILTNGFDYSKVQTVDWVIGAFIMVTRKAFEATGGLDETYFMYAEDLDWCTRIRQCGMEVVYFPRMCITYKGTRRARSKMKYAKIFIKSHLGYWRKFGFVGGYPKRRTLEEL